MVAEVSYEIAPRWMPQDLTDDKSTLIQVMAWCRQATSHYLGQCWPRSMSPYGITRPQWVKHTHCRKCVSSHTASELCPRFPTMWENMSHSALLWGINSTALAGALMLGYLGLPVCFLSWNTYVPLGASIGLLKDLLWHFIHMQFREFFLNRVHLLA